MKHRAMRNNGMRALCPTEDDEMSEWQPIETAPKGQAIVFDEKLGVIANAFLFGNDGRASYGYYNNTAYNVTHWMPLPEPPAQKGGEQ